MDEARAYLDQFVGGSVTMQKDPTRGVAIITLDHPGKKNAISGCMMTQLYDHINDLEAWTLGKACILRGNGGNFSSGGDLNFARQSGNPKGSSAMNQWMTSTLNKLSQLNMFSVCLLEGPTLGGGTEVALACDFIVVTENVKFGLVQGKLGIVTAWGGGTRLTKRVGRQKALDLLLTSRILSAEECLAIGICDYIIPSTNEGGLEAFNTWLDSKLIHHYTVTRAFKEIVNTADTCSVDVAAMEERRIFLPFWGGTLNKEALGKRIKHEDATKNNKRI